jgi:SAM-dependent methyltransferase
MIQAFSKLMKKTIFLISLSGFIFFLNLMHPSCQKSNKEIPQNDESSRSSQYVSKTKIRTTIRNATKMEIAYSVKRHRSAEEPNQRIIKPGNLQDLVLDEGIDVIFRRNDDKIITYKVAPGRPYVFRQNASGELELYPGSHQRSDAVDLAPYVQTPADVVYRMLDLAEVDSNDVVYDIGCGDGRIVIAAAKKYGARGVGIDIVVERIDEERIDEARLAAKVEGVDERVEFWLKDATKADLSGATVVTAYLVPESMEILRPLLDKQLKPGTVVASHGYRIPGWEKKLWRFEKIEKDDYMGDHLIFVYKK